MLSTVGGEMVAGARVVVVAKPPPTARPQHTHLCFLPTSGVLWGFAIVLAPCHDAIIPMDPHKSVDLAIPTSGASGKHNGCVLCTLKRFRSHFQAFFGHRVLDP